MDIATFFFPGDCYEEVLIKYNFLDGTCLKLLNSRILSLQIILGSILVKVPQIVKCLRARSVENLSYLAFFLELAAVTFTCTYNIAKGFPFSSWGESFFISIQVIMLIAMMMYFNSEMIYMAVFAPTYAVIVWYLTSDFVAMELLSTLQALVIPLLLASRVSQIVTTFVNKTTGQLSLITSTLNVLGCAARIFTTIQETGDTLILLNFVAAFVVNFVILLQFAIYRTPSKLAKPDSEKKGD